MKFSLESVVLGLVSLPGVVAWGDIGHETTAYLASYFVSDSTAAYFKGLLENDNDDYLARIAMFADKYRKTAEGSFTKNWHFIDAHDDPQAEDCNVNYDRDCKEGGCVISALTNYTQQALDRELPEARRQLAVKLLVHFIGDLHQPLHNEDVGQGGTQIQVKWENKRDDLHAVWDSFIPEKVAEHLRKRQNNLPLVWAKKLEEEISNGKYASEKNSWLDNFDLSDPKKTAMDWSIEANKLVCSHVFPKDYNPTQIKGKELSDKYYDQARPIVELQVARAGFRMAAWLDEIANNIWGNDNGDTTGEL
ncbi:putative nuclease S1 precursor [Trichoderma barbatum]